MTSIFGGQLLQVKSLEGNSFLYLSDHYVQTPITSPARGGVPVLFPQFANLGPGRKHGFARNVLWSVLSDQHYRLQIAEGQYDGWPHAAQLDLSWSVTGNTFHIQLAVSNTGATAFEWSGGLHPYWLVPDLLECRLAGMPADINWDGQTYEQLFEAGEGLVLYCGTYALELQATGFTQWMVWNPGREGAKDFADMPREDWQRFVCIEPVCASLPVTLQPGENFTGTLTAKRVTI